MQYNDFENLLNEYREAQKMLSELNKIGFDFFEGKYKLSDKFYEILCIATRTHYDNIGITWIEWFIFDTQYQSGKKYEAYDEDTKLICQDTKGLWEYIEKNHKLI